MTHHALRVALLALFVGSALPLAARAQTPSPSPTPPPPPPKQELSAQVAFVGLTGNTDESTLSAGAQHIARPDRWLLKNTFEVIYGDANNVITTETWAYRFRAERALSQRTSLFGDYAFFRDTFSGIDVRNVVNGGLTYHLLKTARQTLSVDGGIGYLNEQRLVGDDVSTATYLAGAAYKLKLSDNAEVTDEFAFLGSFDSSDDWRLANVLAVTAKLTSAFSLKFSTTVRHVNVPVPGFKATDTTTSIALVASFKSKATAK